VFARRKRFLLSQKRQTKTRRLPKTFEKLWKKCRRHDAEMGNLPKNVGFHSLVAATQFFTQIEMDVTTMASSSQGTRGRFANLRENKNSLNKE